MPALEQQPNPDPHAYKAPILTGDGDGDNFDDDQPPREFCRRCYRLGHDDGESYGYSRGFANGAASVRKAPLINWNWSTMVGGILNIIGFAALIYGAMWLGELRGMKSEGRLNITFSDGSTIPEKVSAAPNSPLPGMVITGTLANEPLTVRMKGEAD